MRWQNFSIFAIIGEAIDILVLMAYMGLQIFYGIEYRVPWYSVGINLLVAVLIYGALTLLALHPERIHNITKEKCSGMIETLSLRMLRLIKFIFMVSLLVPCICDVAGMELLPMYNMGVIIGIILIAIYYEVRIIKILLDK